MTVKLRFTLAAFLLTAAIGCGTDVYDTDRIPENAPDTSDPSTVQMEMDAPSTPRGAQPGPPAE